MSIERIGNNCCGCRSCLQKCPLNAITFTTDEYGFEYPHINSAACINCDLCETVCPVVNDFTPSEITIGGMAYANDQEIKHNGSSGGLFGVFAHDTIEQNGIVFGAAFDSDLKLKTQKATTADELMPLYKSKYLLCDTSEQFKAIETELKNGKQVLYCSTPCQIAAIKRYLNADYDNLFTMDFVCHGVGSQTLFDKSIAYVEKRKGIKIKQITFRYKKGTASSHYYRYYYQKNRASKQTSDLYFSFPYYNAYCKQLVCRDSCYQCKFASRNRVSDVTIGDFHTIEKYFPHVDRFAGVSMFILNTQKGVLRFEKIKERLSYQMMDRELLYQNNRFSVGTAPLNEVSEFRKSIASEPFETTVQKFLKPTKDWKKLIYYKLPRFVRKMIMKSR